MSLAEQEIMLRQLTQRPVFEALSPQAQDVMLDAVKRIDSAGKQMHLSMSVGMVMVIFGTGTAFALERKAVSHVIRAQKVSCLCHIFPNMLADSLTNNIL